MRRFIDKIYCVRMLKAKNGAMFMISAIISTLIMSCSSHPGIIKIEEALFEDLSLKDIFLPVTIEILGISVFCLFLIMDFFTGISACRTEHIRDGGDPKDNIIKPDKLWGTLWKLLGVLLLTSLFGSLSLITLITTQTWAYNITMWLHLVILIASSLFEFSSIGDNLKRINGKKPEIFSFVDNLFLAFKRNVFKKAGVIKITNE